MASPLTAAPLFFVCLMATVDANAQESPTAGPTPNRSPARGPGADTPSDPAPNRTPQENPEQEEIERPTPFDQFRWQFSLSLGGSLSGQNQYFVIGLAARFFALDGLGVGLAVDQWLGSDPQLTKISPEVRYVFLQLYPYSPYVGIFYRHWFLWYADRPLGDKDTLGARAGLYWSPSARGGLGLGVAYEGVVSPCRRGCHYLVPELTFALGF